VVYIWLFQCDRIWSKKAACFEEFYGVGQQSNIVRTQYGATVAPVEQQSIAVLHSRQCHYSTGRTAIYSFTAQQTVPL